MTPLLFFICVISLCGAYILCLQKPKIKDLLITSLGMILGNIIITYIPLNMWSESKLILSFIILNLSILIVFAITNYKHKIILKKFTLALTAISMMGGFIFYLRQLLFLHAEMSVLNSVLAIYIYLTIYIIYTLGACILINKYIKITNYNVKSLLKNNLLYYGILFVLIFAIGIQVFVSLILSKITFQLQDDLIRLSIAISIIAFGLISMFLYLQNRFENMIVRQIEINKLQEYTKNIELLNNDMRTFKHDFINIMSSLKGYFDSDDLEGVKDFFYKKLMPLSHTIGNSSVKLYLLQNINIPELKGLLSSKILKAKVENIDIFVDIAEIIEHVDMEIIDLCRVVGILLDNAIEASKLCDNPIVKLGVIKKNTSILFVVINSFIGEPPKIHEIYRSGFSTKGENRGIGLATLKDILSNYYNTVLDTSIENNLFIQNIEIIDTRSKITH